jgi:HIV Tat-specific factor 1
MLEIKEDIREECTKLGEVTNVVLFDKEEAGVASVRFSTDTAAAACVKVSILDFRDMCWSDLWQLMNGRWFDERQLEAFISTGNEKFKKSSDKSVGFDEEDGEQAEEGGRLDKFGSWLEQEKW